MNRHWLEWRSTTCWETMESGLKVSFIILVFYRLLFCLVVGIFIVLSFCFYRSVWSTDYWGDMGEFSGMGRAGAVIWLHGLCIRCTCCYWLFLSMSILISCYFHALVDHISCPIFPFISSPPQIVEIFTTSTIPSSRHFPIYAQIPLRLPSSVSQRFLQTKLTQSRN